MSFPKQGFSATRKSLQRFNKKSAIVAYNANIYMPTEHNINMLLYCLMRNAINKII